MDATRKVKVRLDNEPGTYEFLEDLAHEAVDEAADGAETGEEVRARALETAERRAREFVEHITLDQARSGLTRDLLTYALADVDFRELMEARVDEWMEEADE